MCGPVGAIGGLDEELREEAGDACEDDTRSLDGNDGAVVFGIGLIPLARNAAKS